MIFRKNNIELDLEIVQRIVARIFVHQDGDCHQMQSWESPAWNVTGYFVSEAIKTLQNEGFERAVDQDPY